MADIGNRISNRMYFAMDRYKSSSFDNTGWRPKVLCFVENTVFCRHGQVVKKRIDHVGFFFNYKVFPSYKRLNAWTKDQTLLDRRHYCFHLYASKVEETSKARFHTGATKEHANTPVQVTTKDANNNKNYLYFLAFSCLVLLVVGGASFNKWFHHEDNLEDFVRWIQTLGPLASFVYGLLYFLLEILCLPAFPLTVAAGYLFGFWKGLFTVSLSGTCASAVSFLLARNGLRSWLDTWASKYPRFRAVDKAISKQGFKIVLLLRLSPIFPFAVSNYLYGLTSVSFSSYILASWLGMLPGTIAYVYGGQIGRTATLSLDSDNFHSEWLQQPWVLGLGALATVTVLGQISKLATAALQEEEELTKPDNANANSQKQQ